MIKTYYDALGNVSGYFDEEKECWVPPPPTDMEAEVLDEDEPPAADSDDAQEPVDLTQLTKDELKGILDSQGITYHKFNTKDELIALVQADAE